MLMDNRFPEPLAQSDLKYALERPEQEPAPEADTKGRVYHSRGIAVEPWRNPQREQVGEEFVGGEERQRRSTTARCFPLLFYPAAVSLILFLLPGKSRK
jgi:hypothetical protein